MGNGAQNASKERQATVGGEERLTKLVKSVVSLSRLIKRSYREGVGDFAPVSAEQDGNLNLEVGRTVPSGKAYPPLVRFARRYSLLNLLVILGVMPIVVPVDVPRFGNLKLNEERTIQAGVVGLDLTPQSSTNNSNVQSVNEIATPVSSVVNSVSKSITLIMTDTITHYKTAPHSVAPVMVGQVPIADIG